VEAVAIAASLAAITIYLVGSAGDVMAPVNFVYVPIVLWAALRFGVRGASAANLALSFLFVIGAAHVRVGAGLEGDVLGGHVASVYGFLLICSLVGLIPAIAVGERNSLVRELGESEERFRNLAAAANEGIVISEGGRIVDVNDQALKLFGYERSEMVGREVARLVSPDNRQLVSRSIEDESEAMIEHRILRRDGSEFDAEARPKVMRLGSRVIRMTAIRDVSERRQSEALLNGQYQVLEMIALGRPLGEILSRLITVIESQSSGLLASILVREGGVLRLVAAPSLPPAFNAAVDRLEIGEGQGSCGTAAYRMQPVFTERIEGDPAWRRFADIARQHGLAACWSTPILDSKHRLLGTFGIYKRHRCLPTPKERHLIDVVTHTASVAISRHEDEAALKLSDFSVHQASTPTFWVTEDARIRRVNVAACEVLGYNEEELLSIRVTDLGLRFQERNWDEHWREAREQKRLRFEQPHVRRDGASVLFEVDLNWFEFEGKEYNFVFLHDISERRQLEEKLRQSQKMEAIGQLSGGIAHDFNNLLTVIQGNLGMIRISGDVPEVVAESLDEIGTAVERASKLTEQLLAFGRKQVMQSQDMELNEIVGSFSNMLRRVIGETVEVALDFSTRPLPVRVDRSMIDQVLLNLCLNARDAMPRGGRLTLQTAALRIGADELERMPQGRAGSFACLWVRDTGVGIAPENLRHVFEPFFTTKEVGKGTGLGLASVYGILQQHEGWVTVQSEVGRGSTFAIYLPLREAPVAPRPAPAAPAEVPRGSETVLLVEDDPAVRLVATKALARLGYRVLVATNGREAVGIWSEHMGEIRLLLTDMVMPGGMGGAEIARVFRESKPSLRVIFMSGYSADLAGTDIGASAGSSFLGKPFEIAELASAMRRSMAEA
jgi:PAS domain S-box-containing protein